VKVTKNVFLNLDLVALPVIVMSETDEIIYQNPAAVHLFQIKDGSNKKIDDIFLFDRDLLNGAKRQEAGLTMLFREPENKEKLFNVIVKSGNESGVIYCLTFMEAWPSASEKILPEHIELALDKTPSSLVILSSDGRIIHASKKFEDISGYSPMELAGQQISILQEGFNTSDYSTVSWSDVLSESEWSGEICNKRKNGDQFWSLVRIRSGFPGLGDGADYLIILEDITYLKNIENELRQSDEKFNLLFDTLPEGVVVTDLGGTVTQVNDTYLRLYNLDSEEDITGKTIFSILSDEEIFCMSNLMDSALNIGYEEIRDFEAVKPSKLFLDIQVSLMRDQFGNSVGYVVLTVDVTKKIVAERALRESEARNRALVEAVPDIMFRVNNEGVYLDKMLGNKIDDVFPSEVAAENVALISKAIKTREIQIHEYGIDRGRGDEYYEARFIAIEDDEVLVILRNVTDRSKAMIEIEKSRREAELANRSKSEFLANMSHEIRTPLNSITGFIELLLRTEMNDSQRDFVNTIKKSASSLLQIIDDILDFSKIESNKLEINNTSFNPFAEFESVISLFDVKAKEKGIYFLSYIDPQIPEEIVSDPLRLKQIVGNLLSNAIKFTPHGEYVITEVKMLHREGDICRIEFSVQDTGIGIAEAKQKKIFEAFSQADSSVTRQFGGTGLGLSISQNLACLLGGELKLESEKGVGSRFYFEIEAEAGSVHSCSDDFVEYKDISVCICRGEDEVVSDNFMQYMERLPLPFFIAGSIYDERCQDADIVFIVSSAESIESIMENEGGLKFRKTVLVGCADDVVNLPFQGAVFSSIMTFPVKPSDILDVFDELFGDGGVRRSIKYLDSGFPGVRACFGGSVLVGEDNRINQKLIRLLLKDYGLIIDIAGNGLDVFEMFKKKHYDLILMDMHMPIADGFESVCMIREFEKEHRRKHVPIVALTAKALKGDREHVLQNGMDGYLSKPIVIPELEKVLAQYLEVKDNLDNNEEITSPASVNKEIRTAGEIFSLAGKKYDIKKVSDELMVPENLLKDIVIEFFDDAYKIVEELKIETDNADYDKMYQLSHKLKGAAANLRFNNLSHLAMKIEENTTSDSKEFDYSGIIDTIENELLELQSIIKRGM